MDWNVVWTLAAAGLLRLGECINKVRLTNPPVTIGKVLAEFFKFS